MRRQAKVSATAEQEAPISADRSSRIGFDPLVPAIGFTLLAGMAWLYATDSGLYGRILAYWTFVPWRSPFIDTAVIPGWIRCFREHGLIVYTDASWAACGLGPIIYSPLWLRLGFVPTDPAWTNWLGLGLVSLFLLSLGSAARVAAPRRSRGDHSGHVLLPAGVRHGARQRRSRHLPAGRRRRALHGPRFGPAHPRLRAHAAFWAA